MVSSTRLLGVVLILVGVIAYVVTGAESVTALLPAFLGLPILVLGLLAGAPSRQRPMIIVAVVLAVLGALGTAMNVVELPALLAGDDVERPAAVVTSTITALLCLVYAIAGIRWLVAAGKTGDGAT
jgi:hypothetical protein